MTPFLVSPDVTVFIGARRTGDWFEGTLSVLHGPTAVRVEHVCLPVRETRADALKDAQSDANKLIAMWREKVRL